MADWWAKVFFREFIKHYRRMSDEQIVRDVRQSMDDLDDMVNDTDTFGSKMVRWCAERIEENREQRAAAGRRSGEVRAARARKSGPMPEDPQKVYDFAAEQGLDSSDAYSCWYATVKERSGCDMDGKPVTDWKAFVRKWCATAEENRKNRRRAAK